MAYSYDLKTGLPAAVRPVLRLHIFDILYIFNILTYNLGGVQIRHVFLHIKHISHIERGGVQICHIGHIGDILHI